MIQPSVRFFFEVSSTLPKRRALRAFIVKLFRSEKVPLEQLNYIFCSDERLLQINQQFLKHDYLTDVITFPLSTPAERVNGEIYISVDRVRDNAALLSVSLQNELHRVIFHGALHLCGYRDKTKAQQKEIRSKENFYLDAYFRK